MAEKNDALNILMFGDSAVGKTTFMMSTYGLMCDGGIQGFDVRCDDETMHKKLSKAFERFRVDGTYPDQTDRMESYSYTFYCENTEIKKFRLTDFRGETVGDTGGTDMRKLQDELKKADVILLFLNGYDIISGNDISDSLIDLKMLLNCFMEPKDKKVLIMPLFTQMDRLKELPDDCMELLVEPVRDILQMGEANDNIVTQVVPIACNRKCMMDLDFTMVTMMLFGYADEVRQIEQGLEAEYNSIMRQFNPDSFWEGFKDAFGVSYNRERARARMKELQELLPAYQEIKRRLDVLKKFYDDYKIGTSYRLKEIWNPDPYGL